MTEHWINEVMFIRTQTGEEIVEKQKQINNTPDMFVTATQIFPKGDTYYDAFIYYKRKPNVKIDDTEEKKKYNIKEMS